GPGARARGGGPGRRLPRLGRGAPPGAHAAGGARGSPLLAPLRRTRSPPGARGAAGSAAARARDAPGGGEWCADGVSPRRAGLHPRRRDGDLRRRGRPGTVGPVTLTVFRGARAAAVFLTRLPVGGFPFSDQELAWASAWFPAVGLLLGVLLGGV